MSNENQDFPVQDERPVVTDVDTPVEPVRSGPRTTTIVWGLIVIAVGAGLLARSAGASIDLGLAAIVVLAAAGLLLVVGSVVTSARRRREGAG